MQRVMTTNVDKSSLFATYQNSDLQDGKEFSAINCIEDGTILGHDRNLNELMEDLESLGSFQVIENNGTYDGKIIENNFDCDGNNIKNMQEESNNLSNDVIDLFALDVQISSDANNEKYLNSNTSEQNEEPATNHYYSSGESVADSCNSSASNVSKKKKKRFCKKCGVHFRKKRDLFAHIKTHIALPVIKIKKLSDSHKIVKEYLNTVAERKSDGISCEKVVERKSDGISCEKTGELKLKLKLSASQNFEVVPQPHCEEIKKIEPEKVEPIRIGGIRVLKAQDIKWTPPPLETKSPDNPTFTSSETNLGNDVKAEPLENRYFECPALDGLEQFAEEMHQEKTDDLLKKLLAGGQQDFSATEVDWASNTNEFISIDSLAHMCTVCHSRFGNGLDLFEHKKFTGHDFNNPMQPPPPPPIASMMDMNNFTRSRPNFLPTMPSQPRQFGYQPNITRQLSPPTRPNLLQRFNHMMPIPGSTQSNSTVPRFNPQHQQQMLGPRRFAPPPPLCRMPAQNMQGSHLGYNPTSNAVFRPQTNGFPNCFQSHPPQHNSQDFMRQSIFLKSRLQKPVRPRANFSPNNSPSPPIMSQQTAVRPKFLISQHSKTGHELQPPPPSCSGPPPPKKNKFDLQNPQRTGPIPLQPPPRKDGFPVIQSIHSGPGVQNLQERSNDIQSNDLNFAIGNKPKEVNKNPKDVANLLATRGIIVTHKGKTSTVTDTQPSINSNTNNAVIQKLQLNNSVSIISKKKEEQNASSQNSHTSNETIEKNSTESEKFLSCPFPNCKEKFLRVGYLNRHTTRDHSSTGFNLDNVPSNKILRAYKCKTCSALFSTQEALSSHQKNAHHVSKTTPDEIGIPIIDLRNEDTKKKLSLLGITNYIPLSNKNVNGFYGFPIVSVQGSSNPNVYNLGALGAGAILSLGPIKQIPIQKSDGL